MEAVNRTRHAILVSDEPETQKMRALEVLENLSDARSTSFGASEQEVLALAVKEIDAKPHQETRDNLTETLVKQLASGQERGLVVCSSGKISRIIGTFDGTDTFDTEARPMWAVREEMGTLAARIREEYPDDRCADARAEFVKRANEEYVSKLAMNPHILAPIIDEYAEAF